MAKAAILLSLLAFVGVVLNVVVGAATGFGWLTIRFHFDVAIPSTIIILFAWTVVVFYFIGACAWVREAIEEGGCDPAFLTEAKRIRGQVIPWIAVTVLLLSAAYIVGGGAHSGSVSWVVHLALALLALLAHVVTVYRTIVFIGMMLDLQGRTGPNMQPAG